jgi:hypothetical protein
MNAIGYALIACGPGTQLAVVYRGPRGGLLKRAMDAKTRRWTQKSPRSVLDCCIVHWWTTSPEYADVIAAKRRYLDG